MNSPLHQELLDRAQSAELVSRFAQTIGLALAIPGIVAAANAMAQRLCGAQGACLLLVDSETGALWFDAHAENGKPARHHLPERVGIAFQVAARVEPLRIDQVEHSPYFDRRVDLHFGFSLGSLIAAPVVLGGDVLGVLEAARGPQTLPFTPVDLERLIQLAEHVAVAVHNAQTTAQLRQTQATVLSVNASLELKVQERTSMLSRAKAEWERTFDAIREPIVLQDGFVVRRANVAYARKVGLPITQVPGKTCHRLLANRSTPCDGCPLLKQRHEPLAGEVGLPDASVLRFSGYWISNDPSDPRVVVHYQDITQQKQMAERLRESERMAALGQLASGAAHEINNPIGFVHSNLRSLRTSLDEMTAELKAFRAAAALARSGHDQEAVAALRSVGEGSPEDLSDSLEMISESLDGVRRVAAIVQGLRELSRLEIGKLEPTCVNTSVSRAVRGLFPEEDQVVLSLGADAKALIPPLQLDRVLSHLLENAKLATGPGQRVRVR